MGVTIGIVFVRYRSRIDTEYFWIQVSKYRFFGIGIAHHYLVPRTDSTERDEELVQFVICQLLKLMARYIGSLLLFTCLLFVSVIALYFYFSAVATCNCSDDHGPPGQDTVDNGQSMPNVDGEKC